MAAFWGSGASQVSYSGASDGPTTVNKTYSDHPWDVAMLDGVSLPGICEVLDGLTQIGIDNKKPDGADGSTITVKGYRPGPFEISCTVWTEAQWSALQDVISRVWRQKEKAGKQKLATVAISVYHPALDLYGISSCAITGVTFPRPGAFADSKNVKFKCLENAPSSKKKRTKTAKKLPTVVRPLNQSQPEKPSNDNKYMNPTGGR